MTSVSDMVNNFLQAEEKNFSLFNFVNELNRCELDTDGCNIPGFISKHVQYYFVYCVLYCIVL